MEKEGIECPLCASRVVGLDGLTPPPGNMMVCPGCAGILYRNRLAQVELVDPKEVFALRPDLYEQCYETRDALIQEWDRTEQYPTMFAWVCVQVYRENQRKVH